MAKRSTKSTSSTTKTKVKSESHIIQTGPDANNMYHLKPEDGYVLLNTVTGKTYSEAITTEPKKFKAVPIESA